MLNGSLRRSREKFASTGLSRGERAGLLPPDGLEQLCRRLKATPTIVLWEWRVCSGSGACALGACALGVERRFLAKPHRGGPGVFPGPAPLRHAEPGAGAAGKNRTYDPTLTKGVLYP
jgi:hypothetical protein